MVAEKELYIKFNGKENGNLIFVLTYFLLFKCYMNELGYRKMMEDKK